MIPEEQQDQAALYALGLLGADEDAAFESQLRANAELRFDRSIAAPACIVKATDHG